MALKRINKELTDLGRYVLPRCPPPCPLSLARMTARDAGRWCLLLLLQQPHDSPSTILTNCVHSDPPSSCSAGPIGDDLVRHIQPCG